MIMVARSAQDGEPVYGLVALDSIINTNPHAETKPLINLSEQDAPELTTERLENGVTAALKDEPADYRNLWCNNPSKMPDDVLALMPPTVMTFEMTDDLEAGFSSRLRGQGVDVYLGNFDDNIGEAQQRMRFVEPIAIKTFIFL
jgi:hypothetical protein